jgi:hypothetical protein
VVPALVFAGDGKNQRGDHRYLTKPEKSSAGPISTIPVVEVISEVTPAADCKGLKRRAAVGSDRVGIRKNQATGSSPTHPTFWVSRTPGAGQTQKIGHFRVRGGYVLLVGAGRCRTVRQQICCGLKGRAGVVADRVGLRKTEPPDLRQLT